MRRREFFRGVGAGLPVMLGFLPVAVAFAVMAGHSGLTPVQTVLMSVCVFAGASQIMAVGMIGAGAGTAAVILATFILNLRHIIMSACVMARMRTAPRWSRVLLSFFVTDESFAVYTTTETATPSFFSGLAAATYSAWVTGTVIGCAASRLLPEVVSDSLGIALYALFIGLLVPSASRSLRLVLLVLLAAALNLGFSRFMSASWALVCATLLGAGIGVFFVEDAV